MRNKKIRQSLIKRRNLIRFKEILTSILFRFINEKELRESIKKFLKSLLEFFEAPVTITHQHY